MEKDRKTLKNFIDIVKEYDLVNDKFKNVECFIKHLLDKKSKLKTATYDLSGILQNPAIEENDRLKDYFGNYDIPKKLSEFEKNYTLEVAEELYNQYLDKKLYNYKNTLFYHLTDKKFFKCDIGVFYDCRNINSIYPLYTSKSKSFESLLKSGQIVIYDSGNFYYHHLLLRIYFKNLNLSNKKVKVFHNIGSHDYYNVPDSFKKINTTGLFFNIKRTINSIFGGFNDTVQWTLKENIMNFVIENDLKDIENIIRDYEN